MPYGGPPKEDVGPTQGWSGGPPEAPGPRTRTDAGIQPQAGPAAPRKLDPEGAQRDAEETAGGGAERKLRAKGEGARKAPAKGGRGSR